MTKIFKSYLWGLFLAVGLALLARSLVQFPLVNVLGAMVTAILLGMVLRSSAEQMIISGNQGIGFTAKYILRLGIILMGIRLNISDILAAGWHTIAIDIAVIIFTITTISYLGRLFKADRQLIDLVAVGTGVCGAAAIGAVAPLIKAKNEHVAVSVAIIATLGTMFTIIYTASLPLLGLSPAAYGTFAGSTLHELAHVIAAAAPSGPAGSDTAILVKLGRVAFIAPVAMVLGWLHTRHQLKSRKLSDIPVPWFIFGFLGMSLLNTYHVFPPLIKETLTNASVFMLTMAMGAMGLNVKLTDFKRIGYKPVIIGLIGSILLVLFGRLLIWVFAV